MFFLEPRTKDIVLPTDEVRGPINEGGSIDIGKDRAICLVNDGIIRVICLVGSVWIIFIYSCFLVKMSGVFEFGAMEENRWSSRPSLFPIRFSSFDGIMGSPYQENAKIFVNNHQFRYRRSLSQDKLHSAGPGPLKQSCSALQSNSS